MGKRDMKLEFLLAAAGVALAIAPARADEVEEICSDARLPFESPAFERFDRNSDDRLTADEAAECGALAAVYSRLDLDANGVLTRPEYRSFADVWRQRVRTFDDDAR